MVILDAPPPATAQVNRFYTGEFFAALKRSLAADGVVSVAMGQFEGRVSPELAQMLATTRRTLEESFAHVLLIPGGRIFVLASDGPLTTAIAEPIEAAGVATKLIRRGYLAAMLTPDRLEAVQSALVQPAAANQDFHPVLYYQHLRYWTAQFGSAWALPAVVGAVALLVYLCAFGRRRRRSLPSGSRPRRWRWCCCWASRCCAGRCTGAGGPGDGLHGGAGGRGGRGQPPRRCAGRGGVAGLAAGIAVLACADTAYTEGIGRRGRRACGAAGESGGCGGGCVRPGRDGRGAVRPGRPGGRCRRRGAGGLAPVRGRLHRCLRWRCWRRRR